MNFIVNEELFQIEEEEEANEIKIYCLSSSPTIQVISKRKCRFGNW